MYTKALNKEQTTSMDGYIYIYISITSPETVKNQTKMLLN